MLLYSGTKDGISGCREVSYVLHLCYNGECSFFSLERKERTKEKFKAYFFLLLASCTTLKGRNSLRSNSLPFLTLRYGHSLDGEKSRPGDHSGGMVFRGRLFLGLWGMWVFAIFYLTSHRNCIVPGRRGCRVFSF